MSDNPFLGADDPMGAGMGPPPETTPQPYVSRDKPTVSAERTALLNEIQSDVRQSREHWRPVFDRMADDQNFAMGLQWPGSSLWKKHQDGDPYVVNIVLRHIQQLTATLYAKNPRVVAKVRPRILNTTWDGSFQSLQQAMQALAMDPTDPMAMAVLQDAQNVKATEQLLARMGKTLELVYQYSVDEQVVPFKRMLKQTVRRAIVCSVGYVKLGFQRVTTRNPSGARPVGDMQQRMDTLNRMAQDIADGEVSTGSAIAEDARLTQQALDAEPEMVLREGLTFDYPDSNAIIPDRGCRHLSSFLGCRRVTEQFMLTEAQVQEIYGVSLKSGYATYRQTGNSNSDGSSAGADHAQLTAYVASSVAGNSTDGLGNRGQTYACVWETYDATTGLVYVSCDGYCDFLREPASPDVRLERFWPWFAYLLNETYHLETPYPLSDVTLMRDMQMDINRARQGLREHRHAARPKTITSAGSLDDEDKEKLRTHPASAIIELNGLAPGQKIEDLLYPWQGPGIDPNLYETKSALDDILRVVGVQEANLGGTSGATATETSIAESSRVSSVDASMDDMDDMLSQIARAGAQILLLNMSTEIVQQIVGPGAVWPQARAIEVAQELYLEVEAGSSGRPNQAKEVQVMTQLAPILMQVPGINPEWLARQMLSRLDDRASLDAAMSEGVPSIMALNAAMRGSGAGPNAPEQPNPAGAAKPPGPGGEQPNAQGPQGANNAPSPGNSQGGIGPHAPQPRPAMGPGNGPLMN